MNILPRRSQRLFTAAVALSLSSAAQATSAFDYNVVAFGNFTSQNTEVMGALAVGKNATLENYNIGVSLGSGFSGDSLIVGNNLTVSNSRLANGHAVIGGHISPSGLFSPAGSITSGAAVPFDFASELVAVKNISSSLTALGTNGTIKYQDTLEFTGTDAALNVFSLTTAQLGASTGFIVNIPTGSIAVFNISGLSFTKNWAGSFILNGQTISNSVSDMAAPLLFNFSQATSLTFNGSWAGSVLAPTADVELNWGGFFGSLIANNVKSTSEFYNVQFDPDRVPFETVPGGNIPPIPEPSSWVLMIGGLLAVGTMMRRRKSAVNFA